MKTRLEDLIATAERQAASNSYDAAIDTYRTALSEPGAIEAGVQARLDAVSETRDAARGIVRSAESAAPPPSTPPEPGIVAGVPAEAPPSQPEKKSEPWAFQTIEPPAFQLTEDNVSYGEQLRREARDLDIEPISILDPKAPPETEGDPRRALRIALTAVIVIIVLGAILMAAYC